MALGVASLQTTPGYMDADYYFYGGKRLTEGHGFTEMLLWNFLDEPTGLPHPSHIYWMPLASILAAVGMKLFPFLGDFNAAQVVFVFVMSAIPTLTAALSMALTRNQNKATFAGILAAFSGFYLPVSTTTDSFGIFMLLGGVFFMLVFLMGRFGYLALGLVAGFMHLSRADGLLWLGIAGVVVILEATRGASGYSEKMRGLFSSKTFLGFVYITTGYLVVMAPWLIRNYSLYGSLFPSGGGQTLWLLNYDELFSYPASELTFERWWAAGLGEILLVRWKALLLNLQSGFAVQGLIVLGPLALFGAWQRRREIAVKVGWVAWLMVFSVMTVVFPFSGARGGFFHTGAAFMPLIWALAPVGTEALGNWSARRFDWDAKKIGRFFRGLLVVFVGIFSCVLVYSKIYGLDPTKQPEWGMSTRVYEKLESRLQSLGALPEDIVLVNNPPGYAIVSGRSAIVIPDGGLDTLIAVIQRYRPRYILLEFDHPVGLNGLYENPAEVPSGLRYMENVDSTHIFFVEEDWP